MPRNFQHELPACLEPNASLPQPDVQPHNLPFTQSLATRIFVLGPVLCRQLVVNGSCRMGTLDREHAISMENVVPG